MNERIMQAVKEIEAIRDAMGQEYAWEKAKGEKKNFSDMSREIKINITREFMGKEYAENTTEEEKEPEQQYFYEDDPNDLHPIRKDKARAVSDRAKMLDVLRRFYLANAGSHEGMDDFVTLFGAYCNQYIRFNLHRAIPEEKDFGIPALWDIIADEKIQKYLTLLQEGIFQGLSAGSELFVAALKLLPTYSLPALYLFIQKIMGFHETKGAQKQQFENEMVYYARHINKVLLNYCLGSREFLSDKTLNNGSREKRMDSLPYVVLYSGLAGLAFTHIMNNHTFGPVSKRRDLDDVDARLQFLNIPYVVDREEDFYAQLIQSMIERKIAMEQAAKIQKEKDEIVNDFSHTYQNMTTTALYDIAMTLLSRPNEEDQDLGRTALLEFMRKETLTKDVYMMKLKYNHDTMRLRDILHRSCTPVSSETHTIQDVVNQALLMCLISAFYDSDQRNALAMFDKFSERWPSIQEIIWEFEWKIVHQEMQCAEWLQSKGIKLHIDVDAIWGTLGFSPYGYASVFLRNILTELFVNVFKYGDLRREIILSFWGEDEKVLRIQMENFLPEGKREESNSKIGLHAMGQMLRVLWAGGCEDSFDAGYKANDMFSAYLRLPLKVFSLEEDYK